MSSDSLMGKKLVKFFPDIITDDVIPEQISRKAKTGGIHIYDVLLGNFTSISMLPTVLFDSQVF